MFFAINTQVQAQKKEVFEPKTKTDFTLYALDAIEHGNNQEKALSYINKAINLEPPNAFCFAFRGNIYLDQNKYELALIDFNQAILLDSNDSFSFIGRAQAAYYLADYQAALNDLNQALSLVFCDAQIYFWRAKVKEALGDYAGCELDYSFFEHLK